MASDIKWAIKTLGGIALMLAFLIYGLPWLAEPRQSFAQPPDPYCMAWTLTTTCVDDNLKWINPVSDPPVPFHVRLVYGGTTYEMAPGADWWNVGCFQGTIRITSVNDETGVESEEPKFFWWEGLPGEDAIGADATGRYMEWQNDLPKTGCRS